MLPPKLRLRGQKGQTVREMSQGAGETIVGGVVGGVGHGVAPDDGGGAVGGIGGVVDEVDLSQQALLVVLEFAHHFGGVAAIWCACDTI